MKKIRKGNTGFLTVTFIGKTGLEETPQSAEYKIVNMDDSETVIRDTTAISPVAAKKEIILTSADTALVVATSESEVRRVRVTAYYADGQKQDDDYFFEVTNPDL